MYIFFSFLSNFRYCNRLLWYTDRSTNIFRTRSESLSQLEDIVTNFLQMRFQIIDRIAKIYQEIYKEFMELYDQFLLVAPRTKELFCEILYSFVGLLNLFAPLKMDFEVFINLMLGFFPFCAIPWINKFLCMIVRIVSNKLF